MITFLLSCPTNLQIRPGTHPTKTFRSISGASRTRLFGSLPVDASIRAEFSCSSTEAALVMRQFHDTYSGARPIALASELFRGHEDLADALPAHLRWYFKGEPEVSPVFKGRSKLSVEFEGRLEV